MNVQNSDSAEHVIEHKKVQATSSFNENEVLHKLKHYLPAQAPLKDFIHHNTLHAFQHLKFHKGLQKATEIFGYKSTLTLEEFRDLYANKRIREEILEKIISERKGSDTIKEWKVKMLFQKYENNSLPRIGYIRSHWKSGYKVDLDTLVHPALFRILGHYLDQGISIWNWPVWQNGFFASIKEMEKKSFSSYFKTKRARTLLMDEQCTIPSLLKILVGDESLFEHYLFDQQFSHQGWSGMVSVIESQPSALLDPRKISLKELITFELLMEIDALDFQFGENWPPLREKVSVKPIELFAKIPESELSDILSIWQDAFECSYYDEVLAALKNERSHQSASSHEKNFQAMFCIDDRETSLRDYLEKFDPTCETFATPGFFNVEFFFQPENGKFFTKQCPAPVQPNYLIKETGGLEKDSNDAHFTKYSHLLIFGWLITQTLGFWSALKLLLNIFRPSISPATSSSFSHMDKYSQLTIEYKNQKDPESALQVGFTVPEMASRVESLLKSIGLVNNFAPLVYVIGHGSSSVNNPHYAAYDCGACSGRPGSVNARVFCHMANHAKVREILSTKGISIPLETQFMGGLHDTSRDEICFYDEESLYLFNLEIHHKNEAIFKKALDHNSKERARRFDLVDLKLSPEKIHDKIRQRSVALFEPRPELNHATNALCIVGRREISKKLFLDRRAFMNSYNYQIDPEGKYLSNILKAAAPVCGGINLEYYFSRVDNQKLGAGTKLPHNVMGLFGVANGIDGDLRPGLPSQMIEVHDPIRLLIIVEHFPEVVLKTIQESPATYEWFIHEWVHLVAMDPYTKTLNYFKDGKFSEYKPLTSSINTASDMDPIIGSASSLENIPVHLIS